ncbi:MAG: ATP-dependent DNA helicase RecG [Patescibacteria group bacterium]|nr:ATP-dependent DNA helicase RecG [Patescibacteria group bacterium]
MNFSTPIEEIPRVGPQYQKKLKKLGIKTVGDLLFHFPHRYEDFSNIIPISEVKVGKLVSVRGKILDIKNIRTWKKRMTLTRAIVGDDSGAIQVIWFNQPYLINTFKKGDLVFLAGKMNLKGGGRYLSNPAYEKLNPKELSNPDLVHTGRLIPIYPETQGLSSRWLRFIIKPLLSKLENKFLDFLPEKIKKEYKLLSLKEAIWQIHFPDVLKLAKSARDRFIFEELFILSLAILQQKMKLIKERAKAIPINVELIKNFVNNLPFKLTNDQRKAAWQILKDLEKSKPMNRLLEGDVGSGKTIVAIIVILNTAKAGYQNVFMAPTEILAKQHFKTLKTFLKDFNLNIGLITSKGNKLNNEKISRKDILEKIRNNQVDILIGTHALVQEKVKFGKLALVVIDEQHRFGIEQRAKLCQQKDFIPHLLSMTATPIPRTLALTIYGDLDLSLIKELPKGRKKVITKIIFPREREKTYEFIRQQIKSRRQVFVICPRIEPSNNIFEKNPSWREVKAVKEEFEKLSKEVFSDFKVKMLHGKMKIKEREEIMEDFKAGKIDVLVSTSVVEVGVDIPNASVILIEGADKFGLAQLHQFRGRVGRGKEQSFCFLFTDFPGKRTSQRLRALLSCENGFELAEKDLKIRGPGDFSGQRQWGIPDLIMDALKDIDLVEKTRQAAKEVLEENPELKKYPLLKKKLEEFRKRIHLE